MKISNLEKGLIAPTRAFLGLAGALCAVSGGFSAFELLKTQGNYLKGDAVYLPIASCIALSASSAVMSAVAFYRCRNQGQYPSPKIN